MTGVDSRVTTSYETDFYAWTRTQAGALHSGSLEEIDREHAAQRNVRENPYLRTSDD